MGDDAAGAETLRERVREHDRYQVEIRFDYEIHKGSPTRYAIDTYLFFPPTLGISEATYSRHEFYAGIQNYIRLKPRRTSLAGLMEDSASPLQAIEDALAAGSVPAGSKLEARLDAELRLFCSVFKEALAREHEKRPAVSRGAAREGAIDAELDRWLNGLVQGVGRVLKRYRALLARISALQQDGPIQRTARYVDERLSLLTENTLLKAYAAAERELRGKSLKSKWKRQLREAVGREADYRAERNPALVLNPNDDNERFLSRASFLKKYASSVLYLSTERRPEGGALEHMASAMAAGVAMAFAAAITFYAQQQHGNSFTLPLFAALVIGYMFKDRIKELGRSYLGQKLRARLSDHCTTIRTPDGGHQLGHLRERMRFLDLRQVPEPVISARQAADEESRLKALPEATVVRYSKEVRISRDAFETVSGEEPAIAGITDILRIDVRPFLRRMDDPVERRFYLDGDRLRTVRCRKNYPVDVVSVFGPLAPGAPRQIHWSRVVLNRKGIQRIESSQSSDKQLAAA